MPNFSNKTMFSLIKMICSTFSGCKLCLDDRTTFPPELKTLSDLVELAGIAKICLANEESSGNVFECNFHQSRIGKSFLASGRYSYWHISLKIGFSSDVGSCVSSLTFNLRFSFELGDKSAERTLATGWHSTLSLTCEANHSFVVQNFLKSF